MRCVLLFLLVLSLLGCPTEEPQPPDDDDDATGDPDPVDWVDPLIGTGGLFNIGATFPGATTPFGLVRLGPDTTMESGGLGVLHAAGYWYEDDWIEGFSHLHLHGTGVTHYGNVMFMPTLGMDATKVDEDGYRKPFSHDDETLSAGYYKVDFDDEITVELTATAHTGVQRYTFPPSDEATVVLDLAHTLGDGVITASEVHLDPDNKEITGYIHNQGSFTGRVGGVDIWFVSRFSRAPTSWGTWSGDELIEGDAFREGEDIGAWFQWDTTGGEQIIVQTGVSVIDADHARANFEAEHSSNWDFDAVHHGAESVWNNELSIVEVTGGTDDEKTLFYTGLFHTMMMPTNWTEVGGDYLGFDGNVWYADGFQYYTDFSLWDTVRTTHPLYCLLWPDRQEDMLISIHKMQEQGGSIPKWALATGDTGSMIGTPADIMIPESYLKGIPVTGVDDLYEEMYAHATGPVDQSGRDCMDTYDELGYLPFDSECGDATSKTLEFAHHDFGVAQLAQALGHSGDADDLTEQSLRYTNLWNPDTQFFQGRTTEGDWKDPFDPTDFADDYTEANAWHYRFHVPHDPDGLSALFGSDEAMVDAMVDAFEQATTHPDPSLPNLYYWHGNEPGIHTVWMFDQVGRPDLAQQWSRWIMDTEYRAAPDGLAGNDDCGTLSAWYVFAALGFYPVMATDTYLIGSPIFEQATIHLPAGDLVITAEGAGPDNPYVQSVTLNGTALTDPWFQHEAIAGGGTLDFVMGPDPSSWGR